MSSAWGDAWGSAWGDAWGAIALAKLGGDDAPRREEWTKRKSKKHDDTLESVIREAYAEITGKTFEQVDVIVAELLAKPVFDYDSDDEEILLLLA